ncbi:MAG: diacylglycerol/lipid kinase family protein [Acidimicrobiia bacterium]
MRWLVVVNPNAGSRSFDTAKLPTLFAEQGIDADIHTSQGIADTADVVTRAQERGLSHFAAVGGDGTAHHVLNAVMASAPENRQTMALIPAGSGSDFVRTFGHTSDLDAAVTRLVDMDRYGIDIGRIEGTFGSRYFLNAANAGVAAASVRAAQRLPRAVGTVRYTTAFWAALARFRQAGVVVDIDRHRFEGDAINVVAANGQFFGGGLNIAPRATLVDGDLDVQVFSGPRRNAFTVMPRLLFGSHLTHRAVRRYIGGTVNIGVPDAWPVEADGELLGTGSVAITTIPDALDFII